ncbi:MAG: hypothetical protein KJO41_06335 [Bacteroidia bacterium]|nr:hypothetical protein [Bacteroidia bacterium]MBT8278602.1 hypothetical protein [Bacteroidia bacterium]NND24978.1 hypothetical protein [Flavobacteriaceae bacterium]NNK59504.1 hypothetical protein [Flavobacteriaceae bacterium]NNL32628.1 hypothetical protein [Flavobacteriaceae bacterium]
MSFSSIKKPLILGLLFFLPVIFLIMLYPSTHNYNSLEIVNENVKDISDLLSEDQSDIDFKDNITVLTFLGKDPMKKAISALNLKELIYDKFMGFKRFQIVAIVTEGSEESTEALKKELYQYEALKYWHFVSANASEIDEIYNSLLTKSGLASDLATEEVFIIDQELNQRGRLDDREDNEKAKNLTAYGLYSYNCIEVAELKNKMSEDIRILFTEYRQKRKGKYDSTARRAEDLKGDEKN